MEKKSIGQFLAALRKANGLTQKQLAEKLNVSDKAVSRWEREETLPDLSLIPVLAEIFHVTSDEILRGERMNPENAGAEGGGADRRGSERTKKQFDRMLKDAKTKLGIRSIIAAGVGICGMLAAFLCNFGFLRAGIGFIAAAVFFLISVVLEVIFAIQAFSSVDNAEFAESEEKEMGDCKRYFLQTAGRNIAFVLVLLGACLPLLLTGETYAGLSAGSWLYYGTFSICFSVLFSVFCLHRVYRAAEKRGLYELSGEEKDRWEALAKRRKKYAIGLLTALVITFAAYGCAGELPLTFYMEGRVFHDLDAFAEYIETPVEEGSPEGLYSQQAPERDTEIPASEEGSVHYYKNGREVSEEEALTETIRRSDGTVALEYVHRNREVRRISYSWSDDGTILVHTYTAAEEGLAWQKREAVMKVMQGLMIAEILTTGALYLLLGRRR